MADIQRGETLPEEIEAIQFNDLEDIGKIVSLVKPFKATIIRSNSDILELQMTSIVDSTSTVRMGYWVVRQGTKCFVCTDSQFKAKYKLHIPEPVETNYDGKTLTFGASFLGLTENDAMNVALAIGQFIEEKRSEEYERLYAEGQFWRCHINRVRVGFDGNIITPTEIELEYSYENALLVYNEILSDRTARWYDALIECPDGTKIEGEDAIMSEYKKMMLGTLSE